jgi:phosphatidylinositol-3-phosphatase
MLALLIKDARGTNLRMTMPRKGALVVGWLASMAIGCGPPKGDPNDVGGAPYLALESKATTSAEESAARRATHALKTAFVIVMENHNWNEIEGNPSARYINDVLLPHAALATNYHDNPKHVHPSEPNYIWMEAGDNLAILDDDDPDLNYRNTKKHLTTLLQTSGLSWKSYQQGIDGKRCPLQGQADYAPKHNPMVFFSDVTDGNNAESPNCISHVRPEAELATDLANGAVSGYVFITPDRCHNMHDGCASGDQVRNGDAFLATEIPKIQASAAYNDGGAIFVTWDEGEGGDHPIGMIVLSPLARTGLRSTTAFNHSSLLRTMQEIFAVEPLLRDANNVASLGELFTSYP